MFDATTIQMLVKGFFDTLYMTLLSSFLAYVIGLPIGLLLVTTDKNGIKPYPNFNRVLGVIINFLRSVPFVILLISVIPLTRFILGTTLGATATVVPLVIASAPYISRLVESSLKEVDYGVIEAAKSMGASPMQIVWKVYLLEARPSLILNAAIASTTILGYSAMAGFVGGGGLPDIAIRYGYYRNQQQITLVTVILLVFIVISLQEIGTRVSKALDKRVTK